MPTETATAGVCLLLGGVLERHPRLRVCLAHGGGALPFTLGRVRHGYRVRPDLCATDCPAEPGSFVGRLWADSLVHDPRALRLLVDVVGEDRVLLGTDYPFPLGEVSGFAGAYPGRAVDRAYPEEGGEDGDHGRRRKILFDNAAEFLRLDERQFAK